MKQIASSPNFWIKVQADSPRRILQKIQFPVGSEESEGLFIFAGPRLDPPRDDEERVEVGVEILPEDGDECVGVAVDFRPEGDEVKGVLVLDVFVRRTIVVLTWGRRLRLSGSVALGGPPPPVELLMELVLCLRSP
jgi:hypothetical protein